MDFRDKLDGGRGAEGRKEGWCRSMHLRWFRDDSSGEFFAEWRRNLKLRYSLNKTNRMFNYYYYYHHRLPPNEDEEEKTKWSPNYLLWFFCKQTFVVLSHVNNFFFLCVCHSLSLSLFLKIIKVIIKLTRSFVIDKSFDRSIDREIITYKKKNLPRKAGISIVCILHSEIIKANSCWWMLSLKSVLPRIIWSLGSTTLLT